MQIHQHRDDEVVSQVLGRVAQALQARLALHLRLALWRPEPRLRLQLPERPVLECVGGELEFKQTNGSWLMKRVQPLYLNRAVVMEELSLFKMPRCRDELIRQVGRDRIRLVGGLDHGRQIHRLYFRRWF